MALSAKQKYRACQVIVAVGLVTAPYCLSQLTGFSSVSHLERWFVTLLIAIAVSLCAVFFMTIYRAKLHNVNDRAVEVETLAKLAESLKQSRDSSGKPRQ